MFNTTNSHICSISMNNVVGNTKLDDFFENTWTQQVINDDKVVEELEGHIYEKKSWLMTLWEEK